MANKGACEQCKNENPMLLHYLYCEGNILHICTSCLLALFVGAFYPICFQVYEDEDLNSPKKLANCSLCPALGHLNCLSSISASTSATASASSSSITSVPYICPSCSVPNFKYFDCQSDEETQLLGIDKHLMSQLLAASIISQSCMEEAVKFCLRLVELRAKEAEEAHKAEIEALEKLAEFTMAPDKHGLQDDDRLVISSGSSSGGRESGENYSQEITNEEIDGKENDSEGSSGAQSG